MIGKGSTVHLLTEGNRLPLTFVMTVANVSKIASGLKVTGQQMPVEGRAKPRLVGQLASVGCVLQLVYLILLCLSDHCLLYASASKNFGLMIFGTGLRVDYPALTAHYKCLATLNVVNYYVDEGFGSLRHNQVSCVIHDGNVTVGNISPVDSRRLASNQSVLGAKHHQG
jgi:hypothetical protein